MSTPDYEKWNDYDTPSIEEQPITLAEVQAWAQWDIDGSTDTETGHYLEDLVWRRVLRTIASGCDDPAALAAASMRPWESDPNRTRWYA